ncbi:MAG: hypothetical protein GY842_01230 [bacterium]|nr:hypothetical protein [bacterium]
MDPAVCVLLRYGCGSEKARTGVFVRDSAVAAAKGRKSLKVCAFCASWRLPEEEKPGEGNRLADYSDSASLRALRLCVSAFMNDPG